MAQFDPSKPYQAAGQESEQQTPAQAPASGFDPNKTYDAAGSPSTSAPSEDEGFFSRKWNQAKKLVGAADDAISNTLKTNPQNYDSVVKTNAIEAPKTLGREVYEGGKTILGTVPGLYHAFADPATAEEKQEMANVKTREGEAKPDPNSHMDVAAHRILEQPLDTALDYWTKKENIPGIDIGATVRNLKEHPAQGPLAITPNEAGARALEVSPEALGQSAGNVIGGKLMEIGGEKLKPVIKAGAEDLAKRTGIKGYKGSTKGVVGNDYLPEVKTPTPEAKQPGMQRVPYPEAADVVAPKETPELVGNDYTENAPGELGQGKPSRATERTPYAEPTSFEAKEPDLTGNDFVPGEFRPSPQQELPLRNGLERIPYAEQTPNVPRTEEGLVGNEYTEGTKPTEAGKPSRGMERVPYADPTDFVKDITKEDVKSTPGTSMSEEPKPEGKPNPTEIVDSFNKEAGREPVKKPDAKIHERAKEIADAYENMSHDPNNPEVKKSYDSLKKDVDAQWDHAVKSGMKMEPWEKEGQPYKNSKEMIADVKDNGHLSFFKGGDIPADHPLAEIDPKTGLTYNDKFRAVHDLYGHAAHGFEFGPKGEEGAYAVHAQSLSPESIPALTSETRGQNNWVNFGKHLRNAAGEIPKVGEEGHIAPPDRPYAQQKAGILPEEFHGTKNAAEKSVDNENKWYDQAKKELGEDNPNVAKRAQELKEEETKGEEKSADRFTDKQKAEMKAYGLTDEEISKLENAKSEKAKKPEVSNNASGESDASQENINRVAANKAQGIKTVRVKANGTEVPVLDTDAVDVKAGKGETIVKRYADGHEEIQDQGAGARYNGPKAAEVKTPELHAGVKEQVSNLTNNDLKELGKKYGLDPDDYDFKRREKSTREGSSNTYPVERIKFVEDLMKKMPEQEKQEIGRQIEGGFEGETFKDVDRSQRGRADKAKQFFPKLREVDLNAKGVAPEATTETARMSDEELLKKGFSKEDIENGLHLPKVGGGKPGAAAGVSKEIPENVAKNMTEEERASLPTSTSRSNFIDNLKKLPKVQEFVDIAKQGEGGRKWYQRGAKAFDALAEEAPRYFKEGDRNKFTDFVAALSPQQTVTMNLKEALNAWTKWVDAGRPTGKPMEKILYNELTLPETKVNNAVKALNGEEMWPDVSKNSNFKVPSFARNLRGMLDAVTNDGWQGLFAGLENPGKLQRASGYHPISVATRAAAEALGWEPAEAQAAIWAFTKAFTEHGEVEPGIIRDLSEDFADIMQNDTEVRDMLEKLGVKHEELDRKLSAIQAKPKITGRDTPTTENSVRKLGERVKAAGREVPKPKDQRSLSFTPEDTSFEPGEFNEKPSKLGNAKTRRR